MRERDIYNKTDRNAVIQQNIRENMDNIIPAYYLYSDYPSFTLEEMQEFIREDAPYARHPAMEWPWRAYLAKLKQKDITGKPFIDFEAEAPDSTQRLLTVPYTVCRNSWGLASTFCSTYGHCIVVLILHPSIL